MARPFKFTDPLKVWELYKNYLDDLKNQSLFKPELIRGGDRAGEVIQVEIKVPPTQIGFCLFLDIDRVTFFDYVNGNSDNVDPELVNIFKRVNDDIKNKQITGATVNQYNGAIVARMNGLSELIKTENTNVETIVLNIESKKSDLQL